MRIEDLIVKIERIWREDEVLNTWCLEEFQKAPTLYIGIDEDNPAPLEDYPVIALTGIGSEIGTGRGAVDIFLDVGCGVVDSEILRGASGKSRIHVGMALAENLRSHAESALFCGGLGKLTAEGGSGRIISYPTYVSLSTLTLESQINKMDYFIRKRRAS